MDGFVKRYYLYDEDGVIFIYTNIINDIGEEVYKIIYHCNGIDYSDMEYPLSGWNVLKWCPRRDSVIEIDESRVEKLIRIYGIKWYEVLYY